MGLLAGKMSDDFEDQAAGVPAAKPARKKPAARKAAKTAKAAKTKAVAAAVEAPVDVRPAAPTEPVAAARAPQPREPREAREPREQREPESREAPTSFFVDSPAQETGGSSKKRRRRKKKSGQGQGQGQGQSFHAERSSGEMAALPAPESAPAPVSQAAPRSKVDSDEVAKKAWKIFQAEVGEEGLALIDDHDAREISRRCFRLAEIFLDEAARRSR
jgi:hypothetical protein